MENGGYLLAAYTLIWAVLFGYVVLLLRRQGQLRREIEALRKEVKEAPRPGG